MGGTGTGDEDPCAGPRPPPSGLMWGAPESKASSQVSLPEGFTHLLLPCDSQILEEVSLWASEETEEQRGYGICPKSHSTLVAQPDGFSAPGQGACATGSGAVVLSCFPGPGPAN